jgi:hypothetical protein
MLHWIGLFCVLMMGMALGANLLARGGPDYPPPVEQAVRAPSAVPAPVATTTTPAPVLTPPNEPTVEERVAGLKLVAGYGSRRSTLRLNIPVLNLPSSCTRPPVMSFMSIPKAPC